ncbi:MAG: hypothetical protein WCT46_04860 [Candidatus Gracilibacteria bacterium]
MADDTGKSQSQDTGDTGIESPEAVPEASPVTERATIALEIYEHKTGSPIARQIEKINLNEKSEVQIEPLENLYLGSLLLATFLVEGGKMKVPVTLDSFRRIAVSNTDVCQEQYAAIVKLRDMAAKPDSEISKFWNQEIMNEFNNDLRHVSITTGGAIDAITGKKDHSPAPECGPEDKGWYQESRDFVNKYPVASGAIALAGAAGIGYGLYKLFKKRDSTTTTTTADGKIEVHVDGAKESAAEKIWKWTKRTALLVGGVYVAGQILGIEEVQKWLKKKNIDVNKNRFTKALILFADLEFLEGYETLTRGTRSAAEESRHKDLAKTFGLQSDLSLWICGEEKFGDFVKYDYSKNDQSIAAGMLGKVPILGYLFKNERQLKDEKELQAALNNKYLDKYKAIPGWQNMTIEQVLTKLAPDLIGSMDTPGSDRKFSQTEKDQAAKSEAEKVTVPSANFDSLMGKIDSEGKISEVDKSDLLKMIGDGKEKEGLLGDLAYMEEAIPSLCGDWMRQFSGVAVDTASLANGNGDLTKDVIGLLEPDLDDREELADLEKSRDLLRQYYVDRVIEDDLELVIELRVETNAFKDFVSGLKPGQSLADKKAEFDEFKKKFCGEDGIFKRVKKARERANNQSTLDFRSESTEWDWDEEGKATCRFVGYTLFQLPVRAVVNMKESPVDGTAALTISAVAWSTVVKGPVKTAGYVSKPFVLTYKAGSSVVAGHHERYLNHVAKLIREGGLSPEEALVARTRLIALRDRYTNYHWYSGLKKARMDVLEKKASNALSDLNGSGLLKGTSKTADVAADIARVTAESADEVTRIAARIRGTGNIDDLSREIAAAIDISQEDAVGFLREIRAANGNGAEEFARIIVEYKAVSQVVKSANVAGDTIKMSFAQARLKNVKDFLKGSMEGYKNAKVAEAGIVQAFGKAWPQGVSPDVAGRLAQKFPDLAKKLASGNADDMSEIYRTMKVTDSTELVKKADVALKAERALLVVGVVVDIFMIGMSLYRIEDLKEMIANAENPAIKEIYKDKLLREHINLALTGTSLVISVSALALSSSAVASGVAAGLTAAGVAGITSASLASAATGIGLVLVPIILIAGGVMHVYDRVDESKIEIARQKEDWKQLPTSDLYREWVTMVGTNDGEKVMACFTKERLIYQLIPGGGLYYQLSGKSKKAIEKNIESYKQEKVVTRQEIVEALIEKNLNILGKEASLTEDSLKAYAMQYVKASLGDKFDVPTIEGAKTSIDEACKYAKLMVAREQIGYRREFFTNQDIGRYFETLSPANQFSVNQVRLTRTQVQVLPDRLRQSYETLVGLTSYADLIDDDSIFTANDKMLPASADVAIDIKAIKGVLGDFDKRSAAYLEGRLAAEHSVIFENLKRLDKSFVLARLNEIRTVSATGGKLSARASAQVPILELYLNSVGVNPVFEVAYPSSTESLEKWCLDMGSSHVLSKEDISRDKGVLIRSDKEILDEYGVAKNKFLYAIYKLAVNVFGYAGSPSEDALKQLYYEGNRNAFGLYWNGERWFVQEAGMEFDEKLSDTDNYDKLLGQLIDELEDHGEDIFEETSDMWFVADIGNIDPEGKEYPSRSKAIADYFIKTLTEAGTEFDKMKVIQDVFKTDVLLYIKEHASVDKYIVLPGDLLMKGIKAGVQNLGCFAYKYEQGKVVCYRLSGDQKIEKPSIFGDEGAQIEIFPVIDASSKYKDKMIEMLKGTSDLIHASGNELDVPKAVDDVIKEKNTEVAEFIDGLSAFPQIEQERLCRDKLADVAEFERVTLLTVFVQANSGSFWGMRWSDDVDSATVDEDISKYVRLGYSFNNVEPLNEYWKNIDGVCKPILDSANGEKYGAEYTNYFTQAVSLALVESSVLKHNEKSGETLVQGWKDLDKSELGRDIRDVLMYDEWVKEYKGEESGIVSASTKLDFQREVVRLAA